MSESDLPVRARWAITADGSGPQWLGICAGRITRLGLGYHADLRVFAPDEQFVVDPAQLRPQNRITPYAGRTLTGVVRSTWLRGRELTGEHIGGQLLTAQRRST